METNRESKRYFRKIPSLKFLYEISNDGRVLRNIKSKKVHRQFLAKNGYYVVNVKVGKDWKVQTVHSLVAECWLGPRPEGYVVDHINRDRTDNYHGNLRYVTYKDNLHNTSEESYSNVLQALDDYRGAANQKAREILGHRVIWNNMEFESFKQAAQYIADAKGVNFGTIRTKFTQRRKYIQGSPVKYL